MIRAQKLQSLGKGYQILYSAGGFLLLGFELLRRHDVLASSLPKILLMAAFLTAAILLDFPIPRVKIGSQHVSNVRIQFVYPVYALGILLLKDLFVFSFLADLLIRLREKSRSIPAMVYGSVRMVPVVLVTAYLYQHLGGGNPETIDQVRWFPFAGLTLCLAFFDASSALAFPSLMEGKPPWRISFPLVAFFDVPFTPLSIPLYLLYHEKGLLILTIYSLPLIALFWLVRQYLIQSAKKEESIGLLNMANDLISASLNYDVMIRKIADKVREIFDADQVEFFLKTRPDGTDRDVPPPHGRAGEGESWRLEFSTGEEQLQSDLSDLLNRRIASEPGLIRDVRKEPEFSSYLSRGLLSLLLIPLFSENRIAGCMVCSKKIPDYFYSDHLDFSRIFSNQVSAALYGAKLHKELSRTLTELQKTQEKLIHSEKMAGLGKMAAGVAHEINNPLGAVLLNAEELQKNPGDSFALEIILEATQQCKSIVDRLLRFSRQAGSQEQSVFSLEHAVVESIRIWEKQLELDGIRTEVSCPDGLFVPGSEQEFTQVLFNLISNSRDAITQKNSKNGLLSLRAFREGENAILEVSDNGTGIPDDVLPKIFEPFFTTKDINKGTGLGLSVSYGIIAAMGGTIDVKSRAGEGATFTLKLPLSSPDRGKGAQEGAQASTPA